MGKRYFDVLFIGFILFFLALSLKVFGTENRIFSENTLYAIVATLAGIFISYLIISLFKKTLRKSAGDKDEK
jgi:uncharacterized membrane protein YbhN (UPF0104 family)